MVPYGMQRALSHPTLFASLKIKWYFKPKRIFRLSVRKININTFNQKGLVMTFLCGDEHTQYC